MASKTLKMRDRLAHIADKSREEFEQKKKVLEAEMQRGRTNIGKIQRGLKNNEIIDDPELGVAETLEPIHSPTKKAASKTGGPKKPPTYSTDKPIIDYRSIDPSTFMPTGLRVSDWCFNGVLDSAPPVVKSNAVYENIRFLGRGSFGDVYLVKNVDDNKLFANKIMLCEREDQMKEMLREVKFLRMNRHPCIIDIHDGFITAQPRILNIVTSYCEAGDLAIQIASARKTRNHFSESQIIKWTVQIALALHFIHENGMVHRDLKPSNVMLADGMEIVKVADFGLVLDTSDETMYQHTEAGTPVYFAPEMILGAKCSFEVDCFSFGVMLHELMRLELPFYSNNTTELARAILKDDPPPVPAHYSEDLKNICNLLMSKDPTKRLGFAGLLQDPLFFGKASSFPASYRPKALEERIRRSQTKQLTSQVECLAMSRNSSSTSVTILLAEAARCKAETAAAAEAAALQASEDAEMEMSKKSSPTLRQSRSNADAAARAGGGSEPVSPNKSPGRTEPSILFPGEEAAESAAAVGELPTITGSRPSSRADGASAKDSPLTLPAIGVVRQSAAASAAVAAAAAAATAATGEEEEASELEPPADSVDRLPPIV